MTATESVVIIRFAQSSQAYQALSDLRGLGESLTSVGVRSAALVERRPDGTLRVPEQGDAIIGAGVVAGGLIGTLVGVLGGPLGVLLGFGTGALVGGLFDIDRATSVDGALARLSAQVPPGSTALIVEAGRDHARSCFMSSPPASKRPSSGGRLPRSPRRWRPPRPPPRRHRRKPTACCASASGPKSRRRSKRRSTRSRRSCASADPRAQQRPLDRRSDRRTGQRRPRASTSGRRREPDDNADAAQRPGKDALAGRGARSGRGRGHRWVRRHRGHGHAPPRPGAGVGVSNSANYSTLWLATAAAAAVVGGGRGRRAACQGVLAIALTSTVTNLILKPLARRKRPARSAGRPGPDSRRVRRPVSTVVPARAMRRPRPRSPPRQGRQRPALWLPLQVAAATVAYSQVHTGVHYPSDVVVGAIIGDLCGSGPLAGWPGRGDPEPR